MESPSTVIHNIKFVLTDKIEEHIIKDIDCGFKGLSVLTFLRANMSYISVLNWHIESTLINCIDRIRCFSAFK